MPLTKEGNLTFSVVEQSGTLASVGLTHATHASRRRTQVPAAAANTWQGRGPRTPATRTGYLHTHGHCHYQICFTICMLAQKFNKFLFV